MTPPALRARGLRVVIHRRTLLDVPQLAVEAGCWTAVVGPNGAGKSTLLKSLAQLMPSTGSVEWLGRELAQWRDPRARARAVAWLGQGEAGGDDLLARDVVMLGRLPYQGWLGLPSPDDHAAVTQAMQRMQCWDWRDRPLGTLSGGERQRVLLARLLAVQAQVLLMDEPLANLDAPHQADWLIETRRQVAEGRTVLSVLHELNIALHADRLLVLAGGRVVHHGASGDPATQAALRAVFDQRIELHQVAGRWVVLPR